MQAAFARLARVIIATLFTLLISTNCVAQDVARVGAERASPRVMLVVDVSGSMKQFGKLAAAVQWALDNVINIPHDDIEIGVVTFTSTWSRYSYTDDNGERREWFRLPSATGLNCLHEALASLSASGSTDPTGAINHALRSGAQTLVFITDGELLHPQVVSLLKTINAAKEWAKKEDKILPVVTVMGIHPDQYDRANLETIASVTGNNLWIKELPEPEIVPDDSGMGPHRRMPPIMTWPYWNDSPPDYRKP